MDRPPFVSFEFLFERVQLSVMQVAEPCNFVWFSVVVVMHFADAFADHAWFTFEPSSCQSFCCDSAPVVSRVLRYVIVGGAKRAKAALKEAEANEGHHLAAVALGEVDADASPVKSAAASPRKQIFCQASPIVVTNDFGPTI